VAGTEQEGKSARGAVPASESRRSAHPRGWPRPGC
jgi:hypothetical protein